MSRYYSKRYKARQGAGLKGGEDRPANAKAWAAWIKLDPVAHEHEPTLRRLWVIS